MYELQRIKTAYLQTSTYYSSYTFKKGEENRQYQWWLYQSLGGGDELELNGDLTPSLPPDHEVQPLPPPHLWY